MRTLFVHIGSVVGMWGGAGVTNYASSKSAVVGLARSPAWELGSRNITANVVAPGLIETELTAAVPQAACAGAGRLDEVPPAVRFLASEEASSITGALLPVSGGAALGH